MSASLINVSQYLKSVSLALVVIASQSAVAKVTSIESSVGLDLQHTISVNWQKRSKFRHSGDCYPFGKGDELDDLGSESILMKSANSATGNVGAQVNSANYGSIGSIQAKATTRPGVESGQFEVSVELTDAIVRNGYRNIGDSDCVIREYHWSVQSHLVDGTFTYSFKMPVDTWLVRISFSDVAANLPMNVEGDLHRAKREDSMFVWGHPGSMISIPIKVSTSPSGGRFAGFKVKIDTLPVSDSTPPARRWRELRETILRAQFDSDVNALNLSLVNLLKAGSQLLSNSSIAAEVSGSMGSDEIRKLLDWLFQVANSSQLFPPQYDNHVKAMSAAVGYKLALALLNDMSGFCSDVDVCLPLSNRTVRTSGFIAASYYVNRDIRGIEGIRFPEIRAYLDGLVTIEKSGALYSDVAKSDANYKKIREAYTKILRSSEIAFDVYGDVQLGIELT